MRALRILDHVFTYRHVPIDPSALERMSEAAQKEIDALPTDAHKIDFLEGVAALYEATWRNQEATRARQ